MERFRYWRDPAFVICCAAYAINRFALRDLFDSEFLSGQFNDLLLIPCALPVALFIQRRLGLRPNDRVPGVDEIAFHLLVWSILFEGVGPWLMRSTVSDFKDVIAYVVGGIMACVWWNRSSIRASFAQIAR